MDQDEYKNGHDFNFETLDKRNNIIPFELFHDEQCLLNLPATWFKEFDDLLSIEVINLLCNAIVDIVDLEKDKKDSSGDNKPKKVNRNPMYIDKIYLKRPRMTMKSNQNDNRHHSNSNTNTNSMKYSLSPPNTHSHSHHSHSHSQSQSQSQSQSHSMMSSHHNNYHGNNNNLNAYNHGHHRNNYY